MVPKFASFRPRILKSDEPTPSLTPRPVSDDRLSEFEHPGQNQAGNDHDYKGTRSRRERDRKNKGLRYEKREGTIKETATSERVDIEPWDDGPELFVTDKYGDSANLTYGALHRYTIPIYHRSGAGNVLGLSSSRKIDRYVSNEKFVTVLLEDQGGWNVKRNKSIFAKSGLNPHREIRIRSHSLVVDEDHNAAFLPFGRSRMKDGGRKNRDKSPGPSMSTSSGSSDVDYRSTRGKAKPSKHPDDSDLQYTSANSGLEDDVKSSQMIEEDLRRGGAILSQKVDADSTNCDAWMNLIDHQDRLLTLGKRFSKSNITSAEKSSTADIKLSMLEKALTKVTDPRGKERLLLRMMDVGSAVWEMNRLSSKWRSVLQTNPGCIDLWIRYLDFQQMSFSTFRYEDYQEAASTCLKILQQGLPPESTSQASKSEYDRIQLYVLLRFTLGIREAGYPEHASAIWQANLEYNLSKPRHFADIDKGMGNNATPDILKCFEDFWESEVPRIGDEGFRGWADFAPGDESSLDPKKDATSTFGEVEVTVESWVGAERRQSLQARRPARTIDDVEEDDPYRIILFSDIRSFLLLLSSPTSLQDLAHTFLSFCHLPPPSNASDQLRPLWRDAFIRNESLQPEEDPLGPWIISAELRHTSTSGLPSEESSRISLQPNGPFSFPMPYYVTSMDAMFTRSWLSSLDAWKADMSYNQGPVEFDWVSRILRALVDLGIGGDNLAEYVIAFQYRTSLKSARQTARSLLKRRPSSLRLYNTFALLEFRSGKTSAASTVMATAINMSESLDDFSQRDVILLWRTWIWELCNSGEYNYALERLLTYPATDIAPTTEHITRNDLRPVNPTAFLRTQQVSVFISLPINANNTLQALTNGRDYMLSVNDQYHAILYSECLVLLKYMSSSLNLEVTLSCWKSNLSLLTTRISPTSQISELFHQVKAQLLYHHIEQAHPFKPSLIRSTLSESIHLFPHNTVFLWLYAWNESRFRIDDRVRSIIQDTLLSNTSSESSQQQESIISHFFAVYTELNRGITLGSNVHAIRGTFERAMESTSGKQSAALWKFYFMFERSRGDLEKAKKVFYRGMVACPWAKGVYMLAFEYLRDVMTIKELRGVYEAMAERGLRIHVSLEEWWERLEGEEDPLKNKGKSAS